MYPTLKIQVVSDISEQRQYIDRQNNTSRTYTVRTVTGICSDFGSASIVSFQVPERVQFDSLTTGDIATLAFTKLEIGKGIWQCICAGLVRANA